MQRHQHDAGNQAQVRAFRREPAHIGDLVEVMQRLAGEVRALHEAVIAQRIRQPRLLHQLLKASLHVVAPVVLAAVHNAKLDGHEVWAPLREGLILYVLHRSGAAPGV